MTGQVVYFVVDSKDRLAWVQVRMWGATRYVAAIFEDEDDALRVALEIERASGVLHTVAPLQGPISGIDASFAGRAV